MLANVNGFRTSMVFVVLKAVEMVTRYYPLVNSCDACVLHAKA